MRKGRDEARRDATPEDVVKVRRSAGKRPFEVAHPEVWPALENLIDPITRGDPASPLRWTCKSTHALSAELFVRHGFRISHKTVAKLLRDHGYHVSHFPPGTSKWNKVEHRLFSFISINWRGRPLRTYETVINLIGNTTNRGGLVVRVRLDRRRYPTAKKILKKELRELKVEREEFHGEWNDVIRSRMEQR